MSDILPFLDIDEAILLTGSRQSGKTSLMYLLADFLLKEKRILSSQIVWLDMEKISDLTAVNGIKDFDDFLDFLRQKGANPDKKTYVFIDEVQNINHASSFLKYLYDHYRKTIKFVVSGSSSLDIKKKFSDRLTGRIIRFSVDSLSFEEFLAFKGKNRQDKDINLWLEEYVVYGGLPRIVLTPERQLKEKLLSEIYSLYVRKDIKDIGGIPDVVGFNKLVGLLAVQIGSLINEVELSNSTGLSRMTVRKYLFILENTFVVDFIRPFYRNPRTELVKTPKIYFKDLGLRNAALDNFTLFERRTDLGHLTENYVYCQLSRKHKELNFWRSKAKEEVDFLIGSETDKTPIEVKHGFFKKPITPLSLKSYIRRYRPTKAMVVNKNLEKVIDFSGSRVAFLPIYKI